MFVARSPFPHAAPSTTSRRDSSIGGRAMMAILTCVMLLLLAVPPAARADDDPKAEREKLFDISRMIRKDSIWKMTGEEFEKTYKPCGFEWTSTDKTSARSTSEELHFREFGMVEALVYFENNHVAKITLNLYTRGDAGDAWRKQLEETVTKVSADLTEWSKTRGRDLSDFAKSGLDKEARLWVQGHLALQLEWSYTGDRAEYLRLQIFPPDADGNVSLVAKAPKAIFGSKLRENVTKADNGDVYIANVPMVDQGEKGYCAVAVMERVLRYFGREADQNEIAKIASTDGGAGTDPTALHAALTRYGSKLGVRMSTMEKIDGRDFERLFKDYNSTAKRMKRGQLELPKYGTIYVSDVYLAMDREVLQEVRMKSKSHYDGFVKEMEESIDAGLPLEWGVMLGMVPEKEIPQAQGGHLRLIIGYNAKTDEILYSDTWGKGHELKRMPTKDAWTISTLIFQMKPN